MQKKTFDVSSYSRALQVLRQPTYLATLLAAVLQEQGPLEVSYETLGLAAASDLTIVVDPLDESTVTVRLAGPEDSS